MTAITLKDLVREPGVKEFGYIATKAAGLQQTNELSAADLVLKIKYMAPRAYEKHLRDAMIEGADRTPVTKGGLKQYLPDEDAAREAIVHELLKGWKMNVKAAYALEAQCDLSALEPTTQIPYTPENVQVLCANSQLAAYVNALVRNHTNWFSIQGAEKELEGNLPPGQSSSTGEPPAVPVSKGT